MLFVEFQIIQPNSVKKKLDRTYSSSSWCFLELRARDLLRSLLNYCLICTMCVCVCVRKSCVVLVCTALAFYQIKHQKWRVSLVFVSIHSLNERYGHLNCVFKHVHECAMRI